MAAPTRLADALHLAQKGDNDGAQNILAELLATPGHRDAPQAATLLGRLRLQHLLLTRWPPCDLHSPDFWAAGHGAFTSIGLCLGNL